MIPNFVAFGVLAGREPSDAGIGPFGRTTVPPAFVTRASASSIDGTPIVFEFDAPSERRDIPPSMPRSDSAPVVMTQKRTGLGRAES